MANEERKLRIRPELRGVHQAIVYKLEDSLEAELKLQGLVNEEGEPVAPLTETNLDVLGVNIIQGVNLVFSQAKFNVPVGGEYIIDEVQLVESISEGLGKPEITVTPDNIYVVFTGE